MRIILVALGLIALALSSPAEARTRYRAAHPDCNILWPCEGVAPHPRGVRVARQMPAVQVYRPPVETARRPHRQSRRAIAAPARPRASVSLDGGVVPVLAEKVREIVSTCGSTVWSSVRHTFIAGTRTISQHANGTAVDVHGNPSCIYALLKGWPGGYSIDYGRVNHVHISYGGREHGSRFAHGGGRRYARRHFHRTRFASRRPG